MDRREVLLGCAGFAAAPASPDAAELGPGPHLFLDDVLIERAEGIVRKVHPPRRHPDPVLESARFGVTQPYVSVARSGADSWRLWYNRGPAIWHAESTDGVRWTSPRVSYDASRGYGAAVLDDAGRGSDPSRRFKLAHWSATRALEDSPRDDGGIYVATSRDGFDWTAFPGNPVLRTWPAGWPKVERHGVGDTVDIFLDPRPGSAGRRYGAAVKLHALPEDGYAPAPKAGRIFRRLVGITYSSDFLRWETPRRILVPDRRDEGLLEFYGMGGVHARGPLLIGFARVLRDDLPCDPGGPVEGIGYTVLAWSRDGLRWERDREPFLDRNPEPGTWDHAMAWGGAVALRGQEGFLYYGGYARGHKVAPERERQLGLARFERDRYVSRAARGEGILLTRPLLLPSGRLLVNARGGPVRTRLLDPAGRPLSGFGESAPIAGDSHRSEVRWRRARAVPTGVPVRIEFRLREAELFAFEISP